MTEAKIIADSISPENYRITTFVLTYPRIIHSELMTHRVFSRNAASSRAVPISKMVEKVKFEGFMPDSWPANQKGMQSVTNLDKELSNLCNVKWLEAKYDAIKYCEGLSSLGVHKAIANRLIEPFMYMKVIVTATDYHNFFALRAHPAAQPEFQVLAHLMLDAYNASEPASLDYGEWHLPFGDQLPPETSLEIRLKVAVARCARISYFNFDKEFSINDDVRLHDGLAADGHMSPFEHPATPFLGLPKGNFIGWAQYRHLEFGETENRTDKRVIPKYYRKTAQTIKV